MLRPTDDLRIDRLRPLIPPAILMEQYAITEAGLHHRRGGARGDQPDPARRGRPAALRGGALLDPRRPGSPGVRPAPAGRRRPPGRRPSPRHAGLLREAADDGRVEGAHQRPQARRELRDQRRARPGPGAPARPRRHGPAGGVRVPRHDHAPVHRGPGVVGRDRRPDHREPGPPGARLRAVDAGRIQERYRRQRPDRRRRDPGRHAPAPVPVGDEAGAGGHRRHARERRLPRHPPRGAPPAELPCRGHRADGEVARPGRPPAPDHGGLLPRQQRQGPHPSARRWRATSPRRSSKAAGTSSG